MFINLRGQEERECVCIHVRVMCVSAERGEEGEGRKRIKEDTEGERELNKIKTHKRISVSLDTMCLLRREYEDSTKDFFLSTLALSKAPLTAVLSSIRDITLLNF